MKVRQQYKNKQNNAQGQHFEREILAGCRVYEQKGIATIDKTPEPFRVTSKNRRTGEFTGRFSAHAQPDFQGTLYGGRSIMFEAKRTGKDRIIRNVLTDTQRLLCRNHIDTAEQLLSYKGSLESEMNELTEQRKGLYSQSRKSVGEGNMAAEGKSSVVFLFGKL